MRVLVCGSRTFRDRDFLFDTLDQMHADQPIHTVIEGEARGADTLARLWAESRGIAVERYDAGWYRYGKAAGPIRNAQMLAEGKPDAVMAFVDKPVDESRGTKDMIDRAEIAGVAVAVMERSGQNPARSRTYQVRPPRRKSATT